MAVARTPGLRRLLHRRKNRLCANIQAAPGFGSLATKFYFDGDTHTGAETHLVDFAPGGFAGSLFRAGAKRCAREHDCLLVHQQFV